MRAAAQKPASSGGGGQTASPRIESLDFVRGCAILMVVFYHYFGAVYGDIPIRWSGNWPNWSAIGWPSFKYLSFARMGVDGVMLFFVLSGFCIHYSVLRQLAATPHFDPIAFYRKRFFRIVPPYLVAMVLVLGVVDIGSWTNLVSHLTLTHNLFTSRQIAYGLNPNFWSLGVEWQLYLVYPLVLLLRRRTNATAMLLAALAVTLLVREWIPLKTSPLTLSRSPFFYAFDWTVGAFLADVWYHHRRPAFRLGWLLLLVFVPLWALSHFYHPLTPHRWWIRVLCFAVFMDRIVAFGAWRGFGYHLVSRIGLVSYSMYLLHLPLLWMFRDVCRSFGVMHSPLVMFGIVLPLYGALTYVVSCAGYRWVECVSIEWGRRGWPWRSGPVVGT